MKSPKLAFLGPVGTYSHQAAFNRFGASVEYCQRDSIADVFNALSDPVPFAFIPQENSIYGIVIETYDLLRLPEVGRVKFVRGEVTLNVRHSLLVRRGVKLANVKRVLSHEQFIRRHLPDATLVKMPSTAAAAQALETSSEGECLDAAICSQSCASLFGSLEVIHESIQDEDTNFTRFFVMATSLTSELPLSSEPPLRRALLRIGPMSQDPQPTYPSVTELLVALDLHTARLDRRSVINGRPFDSVYFVEVQETSDSQTDEWPAKVEGAKERIASMGSECVILGIW